MSLEKTLEYAKAYAGGIAFFLNAAVAAGLVALLPPVATPWIVGIALLLGSISTGTIVARVPNKNQAVLEVPVSEPARPSVSEAAHRDGE